jgi:nucleoside-diphosphate-sugar epimerase
MRVLIIGCGYVGWPLANGLVAAGHQVYAMRRSPPSEIAAFHWVQADITNSEDLHRLPADFDAVINVVSSTRGGPEEYQKVYLEGTRNILAWLKKNPPARYLYTSSTSVYGQTDASWVTEDSPTLPDSSTSRILVETEQELLRAFREEQFPVMILRVAGIYGPERGHLFKQFVRGEATIRESGESYINSIHLDDVVGSIMHLLGGGTVGEIYNVADDEPVAQIEFFRWLSSTLGKPMPLSSPGDPNRKRGLTNKRVSNAKLRATGYQFLYPTFREGYTAELRRLRLFAA